MLYTINRAWLNILAKQLCDKKINSICCCYCTEEEFDLILKICHTFNIYGKCWIVSEKNMKKPYVTKFFPMFDDILISHDLNDIVIKDFLAKHCIRYKS